MRLDRGQKVQDDESRDNKTKPGLTQDPASCGCHRREGMKAAVLHEASTHEDTWTSQRQSKVHTSSVFKIKHLRMLCREE